MAACVTLRSIVQYGSMLLAIVVVYNLGRHLRTGDGPRSVFLRPSYVALVARCTQDLHDTRGAMEGHSACMVSISHHRILFCL